MRTTASSFYPKNSNYKTDGSGRDSYISVNNGGFYTPRKQYPTVLTSSRSTQFFGGASGNRTVKYNSNGTGRDSYIVTNSGGFEYGGDRRPGFEGCLRSYQKISQISSQWMSQRQRASSRELKRRQGNNDIRLSIVKKRYYEP